VVASGDGGPVGEAVGEGDGLAGRRVPHLHLGEAGALELALVQAREPLLLELPSARRHRAHDLLGTGGGSPRARG
jgi:hypothetical protein